MKSKFPFIFSFCIDVTVFLTVLYLSAVLASFGVSRFMKWQYLNDQAQLPVEALNPEYLAEGIKDAETEGYSPAFYPAKITYHRSMKKLVRDSDFLPLGSQPYENVYYCDEGSGLIRDKLDRMGHRNEDTLWNDTDKIDVVIVGDSIVAGMCVAREHTISAELISKGLNTAALASGGNNPGIYASILKTFIPKVQPKVVVTVFHPNDQSSFYGNTFNNYFSTTMNTDGYLIKDGSSVRLNNKSSIFFENYEKQTQSEKQQNDSILTKFTIAFLKIFNSRHLSLDGLLPLVRSYVPESGLIDSGSKYAIDTAVSLCKEYDCTPIFIYVPNPPFWSSNVAAASYSSELKNYLKKENLHFIDTKNQLWNSDLNSYAPYGIHPSEIGYNIIGNAIFRKISEKKM
jgi:hypothetical protein